MSDDAAIRELPAKTVMQTFAEAVEAHGDGPALRWKTASGVWRDTSWKEYRTEVFRAARGLIALGLEPKKGVAIIGFNRREWIIADIAAIHAGGVPVGIYTTSSPEQCQYIASHADANVAVVEDLTQLEKFLAIRDQLPELQAIVLMKGEHDDAGVYSWEQLLAKAEDTTEAELEARMAAQDTEDICTLIYTSGTTGNPKGVMLSHDNLTWTSKSASSVMDIDGEALLLSYLPLSHIAEQIVSIYVPLHVGACTCFAESMDKLGDNLREIRPHIFLGVPRVWEKIQAKMITVGAKNPPLKKKIAAWARKIGLEATAAKERGEAPPLLYGLAEKFVFSGVRANLGLDRSRLNITSAAPIAKETLDFFASLGVLINEVYGMSECTGPATMSIPRRFRVGWVGFSVPGGETKVADDGEICMRGRHVFKGYYKNPEATAAALDEDGWLHSGDIGITESGLFKITDRKKDLIITAGGENIAPQVIEGKLKNINWVSQAVVVGDRRKHLSALLTLDEEKFEEVLKLSGSTAELLEEAAEDAKIHDWLLSEVQKVNAGLARVQQIKKIKILPRDLSIEGGELTPTMKVKRRIVNDKYKQEIEAFYA
ncbi:AMP-binding protein [Pseudenhygromyxa sp. WMMC2535]|uniref:AMP-dependent synthetase/ligase n=1 Tax=Pseudenhygromyxa sp. WMMC2535 TaxID=2712867 RepID=UPI001553F44F|nr:AMP-binding protein [Pseudenhygromyxa sp. WMMC2535]NVB42970.1 AMP-binding protein [Pseudenhygromyxa sp. WMMC2535]